MFRMEMLPAGNGDCLWIEYGTPNEVHRILIDGGRASTYPHLRQRILALPESERVFELLVVTHIDNDHIEGVIPLLQDETLQCRFNDVWYNGWRHLGSVEQNSPEDTLGPREGEFLGVLLEDLQLPWNTTFDSGAVVVPDTGGLPSVGLAGGLTLTLLTPSVQRLTELGAKWKRVIEDAGFRPGDVDTMREELRKKRYLPAPDDLLGHRDGTGRGSDNSEANGSSITFLAQYCEARILLTGDAFAEDLVDALKRAVPEQDRTIRVDAWKLSHHGSRANFTPELFDLVHTKRFLISTDGSGHGHPHADTVDYIINNYVRRGRPEIIFNYRSAITDQWATTTTPARKFTATFPMGAIVAL